MKTKIALLCSVLALSSVYSIGGYANGSGSIVNLSNTNWYLHVNSEKGNFYIDCPSNTTTTFSAENPPYILIPPGVECSITLTTTDDTNTSYLGFYREGDPFTAGTKCYALNVNFYFFPTGNHGGATLDNHNNRISFVNDNAAQDGTYAC